MRYTIRGAWYAQSGTRCPVCGVWFMTRGARYDMIYSMARGLANGSARGMLHGVCSDTRVP
eukprot:10703190-Lingulodinium_polyedra.AAC.1